MALFKTNEIDLNTMDSNERTPFFSLKGSGNYKFVRFLYKSIDDIVWAVVHSGIQINNKPRNVDCIKTPTQSCPMCEAGMKTSNKAYIEMMVYEHENGRLTGQKQYCIWERGVTFIKELQSNVNRYVPYGANLYDYLWEIERQDGKTPRDTVYRLRKAEDSIVSYCPITPNDIPQQSFDPLKSRLVVSKSEQDMKTFIEVGEFPMSQGATQQQYTSQAQYVAQPQQQYNSTPTYMPQSGGYVPQTNTPFPTQQPQYNTFINHQAPSVTPTMPQGNPYAPQGVGQYTPSTMEDQSIRRR